MMINGEICLLKDFQFFIKTNGEVVYFDLDWCDEIQTLQGIGDDAEYQDNDYLQRSCVQQLQQVIPDTFTKDLRRISEGIKAGSSINSTLESIETEYQKKMSEEEKMK